MRERERQKLACAGRAYWPLVVFLLMFLVLLAVVGWGFLLPGLEAAQQADTPAEKARLRGSATLVLLVVLLVLFIGLLLSLRIHRFFFPRPPAARTRTDYPDAWAESGRRTPAPPVDDGKDD